CHSKEYIDLVHREIVQLPPGAILPLSTGDVMICQKSYDVALQAVGGVLVATDAVMTGQANNAFCIVRPAGHHATASMGMGFCLFNNVAIGARYVQKKYGVKRVLIVDWDVHHGNGTQAIVWSDPSIFYFSTHQAGIYPHTGFVEEIGAGNIMNCPILGGPHSRKEVFQAFIEGLKPAMELFQPEVVFFFCGFDAHREDPLGGLDLTDRDFFELTIIVKEIARNYATGHLISVLEGGYNLT